MKLLLIIMSSFFLGSAFAQASKSSTVTIYGKAATYLGTYSRHENLNFTDCVRGRRSPYLGVIECVLEASYAEEEIHGKVTIFGLAARELYKKISGNPNETGIECFIDYNDRNEREIGCTLKGFIVEKESL